MRRRYIIYKSHVFNEFFVNISNSIYKWRARPVLSSRLLEFITRRALWRIALHWLFARVVQCLPKYTQAPRLPDHSPSLLLRYSYRHNRRNLASSFARLHRPPIQSFSHPLIRTSAIHTYIKTLPILYQDTWPEFLYRSSANIWFLNFSNIGTLWLYQTLY